MTPRSQALLVGGLAGAGAFVFWFLQHAKKQQPHLAAIGAQVAPQIAEDAAKRYIATNFGLTPEMMQRLSSRVGLITNFVNAFQR